MSLSILADASAYILRAMGSALRYLALALRSLYDVYIAIPLQFERFAHGRQMVAIANGGRVLDNPVVPTGKREVRS